MKFIPSKRDIKFFFQRMFRGWDDSELWALDATISRFILPRLKMFKNIKCGYPVDFDKEEQYDEILNKMIMSFEFFAIG